MLKKIAEPECCIGGNCSFPVDDFIYPAGRYTGVFCQAVLADILWLQELFKKYCAGMNRRHVFFLHIVSLLFLVAVDNFNVICVTTFPNKTYAPLIIDSGAEFLAEYFKKVIPVNDDVAISLVQIH